MVRAIEQLRQAMEACELGALSLPDQIDALMDAGKAVLQEVSTLTPQNEPLTLEQLREMDGQPVRMEDLTGGTLWNQWIIFERHTDDGFIPRGGGYFGCDSYGVKWIAYAYTPANIDWESWEPCIKCNGKCYFCKFNETSKCGKCKNHEFYSPMFNFCPDCGRPLTEEAWAELEKRIGVSW